MADVLGEVAEWSKALDSKSSVGQLTEGSNPSLSAKSTHVRRWGRVSGEVTELAYGARLEIVCARKGTEGSNPSLSAVKIEFDRARRSETVNSARAGRQQR